MPKRDSAPGLFDQQTMRELKALRLAFQRLRGESVSGHASSTGHGGRFEFTDHVPYACGDDLRFVDWQLYARLGELYQKRFQSETKLNILVYLDDSFSMTCPDRSPWRTALWIAAGICHGYADVHTRVTLHKHSINSMGDVQTIPFGVTKNPGSALSCIRSWEFLGGRSVAPVIPPEFAGGRNSVLLLVSDFQYAEPPEELLAACAGKGMQISCICLVSDALRAPETGRQVELRDAETNEAVSLSLSEDLLSRYTELFQQRQHRLEQSARRIGAGWVELSTPNTVGNLFQQMIQRGVLP